MTLVFKGNKKDTLFGYFFDWNSIDIKLDGGRINVSWESRD
jgi:hypothetical protein